MDPNTSRRGFLTAMTAGAAAGGLTRLGEAHGDEAPDDQPSGSVWASPPVLQNPTPDGMTVAWAVRRPCTGWVEYGPTPELGRRAHADRNGLEPFSDRYLSVRLSGLTPGEPVYYRVVSAAIRFRSAYRIERAEPEAGPVLQFRTPTSEGDTASFAVINDTHQNTETLAALTRQLADEPADYTVWNGDIFNDIYTHDQVVQQALAPVGAKYAAERPVLFVVGNHDVRGPLARELEQALTPWTTTPGDTRVFAVRQGPLAMIGLDTGEDKPDRHPVFAGLARFEPYREAQRAWLAETLASQPVRSARFVVVFCHIPLRGLAGQNGGDTLEGYAAYCRQAQQLWAPLLAEHGVQLVISGHTHRFRYQEPNDEFPFPQLVGGGPQPDRATLIRGAIHDDRLRVSATALDGTSLGQWSYAPRRV